MIWKLDIKHSCDILERYLTFGSEKLKLFFFPLNKEVTFSYILQEPIKPDFQ